MEEEVDAAIASRKESHPEKWSALTVSSNPSDATTTAGGEKPAEEGGGGGAAGGGGGGGAGAPSRPSTGGGGAPALSAAGTSAKRGSGDAKGRRGLKGGMGSKKASAVSMRGGATAADVTAVGDGGGGVSVMSKKEKAAMLINQAREEAAAAAAEVTHDLNQTPAVLAGGGEGEGVLYSDPASLLNRGWVEMEASLALVFGVEVLVCARWGPKVTFQSVLASSIMSEDGEMEEQGPGFRGAILHGIARIAPDVEEEKGE